MDSSNWSLSMKSDACAYFAFLSGVISLAVDCTGKPMAWTGIRSTPEGLKSDSE